jgi:hypothetical protein
MLSAYPDHGKTPADYLLTLVEILSHYAPDMQAQICDPVRGLPSKSKFLPTAAEIAEFVSQRRGMGPSTQYEQGRIAKPMTGDFEFIPFPKLWEAFADKKHLLKAKSFDVVFEASRQLAMHGKDAAEKVLLLGIAKRRISS